MLRYQQPRGGRRGGSRRRHLRRRRFPDFIVIQQGNSKTALSTKKKEALYHAHALVSYGQYAGVRGKQTDHKMTALMASYRGCVCAGRTLAIPLLLMDIISYTAATSGDGRQWQEAF